MGDDMKCFWKRKERKKERTGTREELTSTHLALWWNLNIVFSVTKQANTFLCRGCHTVWFGPSFVISYRSTKVTPTLHPQLLSSYFFKFIRLHSLSISPRPSMWHVSGTVKPKLMFKTEIPQFANTRPRAKLTSIFEQELRINTALILCAEALKCQSSNNTDTFNAVLIHFSLGILGNAL